MAKDKIFELKYKIEGLKRMCKRKVKRGLKKRKRSLMKQKEQLIPGDNYWDY